MYRWYWFRKLQLRETDLEEPGAEHGDAGAQDARTPARPGGPRRPDRSTAEAGPGLEEAA